MIFSSAPLRISLVGGGSDLPEFTREEPGAVVSLTTDLRMTVVVYLPRNTGLVPHIRAAYNQVEIVRQASELKHDIIREVLNHLDITTDLELATFSPVPAGTGLGSSSALTVALLAALDSIWTRTNYPTLADLARTACVIEGVHCNNPIGRQDAYAAVYGGTNLYLFEQGDLTAPTRVSALLLDLEWANSNFMLFYTGVARSASEVLKQLDWSDTRIRASVRSQANLARTLADHWAKRDYDATRDVIKAAWAIKQGLPGVVGGSIEPIWATLQSISPKIAMKVLGAGGGGCFLVCAPPDLHKPIRQTLTQKFPAVQPLAFRIDYTGVKTTRFVN